LTLRRRNGDVMDPELVAIIDDYARTHGLNLPPHQIVSDPLAGGPSGIEQLLLMLGMAANAGDTADNTTAQTGQAEREAKLTDAETKFPANEEESARDLAAVGAGAEDPMSKMSELLQSATGMIQGLPQAFSGALQPFSELGQQLPQAAQQALQTGMGALQQGAGSAVTAGEEVPEALLDGGLGAAELAGAGGAGAAGLASTMPASELGPPPAPSASTVPASSSTTTPTPPAGPGEAAGRGGGMGGMPMMPPGGMGGAGGTGSDAKADAKRVVPPSVKNGAPVQGRVSTPPPAPTVTKNVQGKPVATKRILQPGQAPPDDGTDSGR
jgi:hypothetical protein